MANRIIIAALAVVAILSTGCQPARIQPTFPADVAQQFPDQSAPTATPWPAFETLSPLATVTPLRAPTLASSATPFATGTPTPVILGAISFPADVDPLTGLKSTDPSRLNRRPVMVKVSNYPRTGRPHAGLSAADLVFEYYIGEYENRFLAVYYSQDANHIGPLRSGRLVDAQLASQYGGILIYGNADPRVDKVLVDRLGTRAVTFDDAPCPPVCGKNTHSIEGVFVDSGAATRFASEAHINNDQPDLRGMVFDPRLPVSQGQGSFLGVSFGPEDRGEWRYDPARGAYLRWIEEQRSSSQFVQVPLIDRNTGKQLIFENIAILFTHYTQLLPTMFEMEVDGNLGGQRAVYFRDGLMIEGAWRSNGPDRPIRLLNSWNVPMPLKPGKTWLILVGLPSTLSQMTPGRWELEYHTQ